MRFNAYAGFNQFVKSPYQAAAAGAYYPVCGNISHQFRRRVLKNGMDCFEDSFRYSSTPQLFPSSHREHARKSGHQAAPLTSTVVGSGLGTHTADTYLKLFRVRSPIRTLCFLRMYLISASSKASPPTLSRRFHDTGKRNNRHVGGPAANVHDHVSIRLRYVYAAPIAEATGPR